jgi:hypothetical protein
MTKHIEPTGFKQITLEPAAFSRSGQGCAGLLVVTGTLNLDGSSAFDGLNPGAWHWSHSSQWRRQWHYTWIDGGS